MSSNSMSKFKFEWNSAKLFGIFKGNARGQVTDVDRLAAFIILFAETKNISKLITKNSIVKADLSLMSMIIAIYSLNNRQYDKYSKDFIHDVITGIPSYYKIDIDTFSQLWKNRSSVFLKIYEDEGIDTFINKVCELIIHDVNNKSYKDFDPKVHTIADFSKNMEIEMIVRTYFDSLIPLIKKYTAEL